MSVRDYSFEKPHLRDPNLHAIERICLLDLFGMEQEQQLGEASTWLRAAAVTRLQQSSVEGARPSTPISTRNARPLSSPDAVLENQRAAKRQATSQQVGRNRSQDIEMEQVVDTPFSQPIQPVQLSGSDPYSTMSPGFDYQLPQTNSQVQQALPPDNVLLSADPQWDFGLADLFTEDYVNNPVEDANSVNPHPFPLPNASVQQYFEASQPISDVQFSTIRSPSLNSAESSHANSSTDVDSHRHTIFTSVVSSGHSHEHTASNMEDMPHAACSTPTSADQVDQVIKHYLEKNPTRISTEDRMQKLEAWVGTRERRAHWERGEIIDYFFGPDSPVPFNSSLPMSCAKAPKRLDKSSSKEWTQLSTDRFAGKRDPLSLAQQWGIMEDAYCDILIMFSVSEDDTAATIIQQVRHAINTAGIMGIPDLPIKLSDLVAWIYGDESSWFSLVYRRAKGSPDIAKRMSKRRFDTIRAPSAPSTTASSVAPSSIAPSSVVASSIISPPNRPIPKYQPKSSRSSSSAIRPPLYPIPPGPASMMTSAQPPDQPHGVPRVQGNLQADNQTGVTREIPAMTEFLREQQVITTANVGLAFAKAGYLRAETESLRLAMLDHMANADLTWRNAQRQLALEILRDVDMDQDLRTQAKEILQGLMAQSVPSIDIPLFFERLGHGLPTVASIADVFLHAPALAPGNPFELAQALGNVQAPNSVSGSNDAPLSSSYSADASAAAGVYTGPLVNTRASTHSQSSRQQLFSHESNNLPGNVN